MPLGTCFYNCVAFFGAVGGVSQATGDVFISARRMLAF